MANKPLKAGHTSDNPLVRKSDLCPLCDGLKSLGLVACWTCYRAADMRNGNPAAEARIAGRERALKAEAS